MPDEEEHEQLAEEHVEATDERDELIIGALAAAGEQINQLAGEARDLKVAASNRRKDDRRRDVLLVLMFVLLVLKLVSEGFAWQERSAIKEQGQRTEHLVETVNRCINPAEGKAPDCGQDQSRSGSGAAQAVIAINNFQLDVAACQASVAAAEYDACVQQRQLERQGEDGG